MRGLNIAQRMVNGSRVFVMMHGMMNVGCLIPDGAFWTEDGARQLMLAGQVAKTVFETWEENHK